MTFNSEMRIEILSKKVGQIADILYLDPIHRGIPGIKEPWPECQSDFSE